MCVFSEQSVEFVGRH